MSNEREKRARLSHACDRCRKRHVKCDGDYPICGNCKSVNGECSYSHPGSKRGYVETIDDRLNKIEQVLSKYLEGVDTQQQYSKSSVTKDINNDPELDVHDIVNMAKSLKIKESSETAQVLSDSMSPSILKLNTRYVTPKKKEVSDVTFNSNLSPKGSMEDLQNSSKESKKIQSLEPPLPKVYRGSKELPPKDLFDHLIQTYLSYGYSSRGPIIHKPTFIKQLRDKNNQPSLLLLNAIFAVASIFSDDTRTRTDPDDPGTAGDIFWTRALSLLDDFMDRGRLSTVQALLFMIQFCIKSTQNSTRIWMLIGMTMRMSTDLGLNRDCSKWDIGKVEKAIRTRVFWAAMNAEVLVCASFGKPLPVYDYNTKFPYEIDDDGDEAQDVVNYMHYSKLMKIYGNVLQSKSYFSQPGALRNTLPAIDAALSSWVLALPPHLQYNPDYSDQNSISVFCSYLNQMYNTVVISLHRPYIDSDEFPNFNSRDICIKAAINITKLSNYIPVDSQGIYLTFSASAYCLVQAATMHILNIGDPDYSHIGQKYMEQTFKSLRKIAQGVRLGHGHCGVDDAINMLEYLYQVQLSKIQDDSETQNFIRRINRNSGGGSGDGGSNRGGGNGGGGNNNDDNDHHHNKSNNKGGNNSDKIYKVKTIPTSPPSSHQQDSADGDSIRSASLSIIKTEKSPMLLDRTQQQQPSSTSLSLGPRKPLSVEHLQYQRQQTHQNMQAHARVRQQQQQQQQNGDLATNHHFMGISPPMVLSPVASLAEPPVVPSSGYYNTNNFNPNMMEFTQNSQIYLGEWDVVGVGNSHHQIPTTGSSPSPSTINHNQTSANVSVLGNSTSPNHPNSPPGSNGNPTSIHQDQSSNYLSYPMNDDQNTSNLFINGSHAMINGNTVQDLGALGQNNVDGTNINVNENNIDNNNSPHHQMMVPPHPHHPMLIQPASHSQSFSNSSTSHHVWVQQQQW